MKPGEDFEPRVLVISTSMISDPGIDYAGSTHVHYPPSSRMIRFPCSSMVRPEFVLHALQHGFSAVLVAADGGDCPYLRDCPDRTSKRITKAYVLLKANGIEEARLKMSGICSVCSEAFAKQVKSMYDTAKKLGPVKVQKEVRM